MSSGGKGSGRARRTAVKSTLSTPSRPSLKRSAKEASISDPGIEPASKESSEAAWINDSRFSWKEDAARREDNHLMNLGDEGDQQMTNRDGDLIGDGLIGNGEHQDNNEGFEIDHHQSGEGAEANEEGEEEEEEEGMSDEENEEGDMDAIDAGAEDLGEEGGEGEEEEGGVQEVMENEGQGGAVTAPRELTETIRSGILAAEARKDAVLEKIDLLCETGLCQLDDMKVRFLAEMSKLKSETVAQADRVCQQWRDLSHETREAEVRLQSVKQLVEVLGTHV